MVQHWHLGVSDAHLQQFASGASLSHQDYETAIRFLVMCILVAKLLDVGIFSTISHTYYLQARRCYSGYSEHLPVCLSVYMYACIVRVCV